MPTWWDPPNTEPCATVGPPSGDTGGDYWVGGKEACNTSDWISDSSFQSEVNQEVAAGVQGRQLARSVFSTQTVSPKKPNGSPDCPTSSPNTFDPYGQLIMRTTVLGPPVTIVKKPPTRPRSPARPPGS